MAREAGGSDRDGHTGFGEPSNWPPAGARSSPPSPSPHLMLVIGYHLVSDGTAFKEIGGAFLDRRNRDAPTRRLVRRLAPFGNTVTLHRVHNIA